MSSSPRKRQGAAAQGGAAAVSLSRAHGSPTGTFGWREGGGEGEGPFVKLDQSHH